MRLYRLYDSRFAATPLSGMGAYQVGGRWNPKGVAALYTASTPELAILESIFRLTPDNLPDYTLLILDVADDQLTQLDTATLPESWRERRFANRPVQRVLLNWFEQAPSLGMIIPSALVPLSINVVLNPGYPAYSELVTIVDNAPYRFA